MPVPMWTFVSLARPVLDLLSAPHSWAHVHFDVWNLIFLENFPPYLPFMCLSCCCCICVFEQWRHCFTNLRLLSGAPSLVEVRQLFLLQYFADFPHTRVNMFALQNSTNTTKNFQNTNYPFTSHSIGERSPKVSIWRVKHIKHHHCDFVKTTNQVNKWYLWIQNSGFLARPTLMHCFREKNHEQEQCFPIFVVKLWQRIG